jgi:hypothetical protein
MRSRLKQEEEHQDFLRRELQYTQAALNDILPDWRKRYQAEHHKLTDKKMKRAQELLQEFAERPAIETEIEMEE